jgi:hypothetical protein
MTWIPVPRWSVDIIRKRAEHLGTVEAATEKEAIKARDQSYSRLSLRGRTD